MCPGGTGRIRYPNHCKKKSTRQEDSPDALISTYVNEELWKFDQIDFVAGILGTDPFESKVSDGGVYPSALSELGSGVELSEEQLISSRWSFGEKGRAPWSTSFYFRRDGRIGGYSSLSEAYWSFEDSVLKIFSIDNQEIWRFGTFDSVDKKLQAIGRFQKDAKNRFCQLMEMPALGIETIEKNDARTDSIAETQPNDNTIKLIIWDLDDTFWSGTLAEGGMTEIAANIQLVKSLNERGIMNSICSKNEFSKTKSVLMELGVWDYFVFPQIDYAPKGVMIRNIIESFQLRVPSVLFIDDNIINLNEALHYNPGLQVAGPELIAGLLDDPRCKGKQDLEMTRLAQYKILEQKFADRGPGEADNLEFLKQSEICVSFHDDLEAEFPRIHELVNRTNQLNFCKNRWPENADDALRTFRREITEEFDTNFGYVKVSDRYGQYGICGFYVVRNGSCLHFTFSCRTLNMGIEQFVWQRLGRPYIKIVGEVVASLGDKPTWISVVDDADLRSVDENMGEDKLSICVRGACDLTMMTHYLRTRFETIEEFPFPFQGWGIHPCARAVALHDELSSPANRALIRKLPGIPPRRFESMINTGAADVYVLSFSSEYFSGLYRSRSTGMILPMIFDPLGKRNFSAVDYESVKPWENIVTEDQWRILQEDFEYLYDFDETLLRHDVENIFNKLRGKIVIVLMLNTQIGAKGKGWDLKNFERLNDLVRPLTEAFGYDTIEMSEYVRDLSDLVSPDDAGVHYRREVYRKMADRVAQIVRNKVSGVRSEIILQPSEMDATVAAHA